jgi:heptosyltransferase-2
MATPTLRAIRKRFPDSRIAFLSEPNLRDLIRGGDWMDECVEWPAKELRTPLKKEYRDLIGELRRRRFDWAILLPNSLRSALTTHLAGARRRIGYDRDGRGLFLTDRLPVKNLSGAPRDDRDASGIGVASNGDAPQGSSGPPAPPGRYVPMPLVEYYADLAEALSCERPGDRLELFTTPDCDEAVRQRLGSLGITGDQPIVVLSPGGKYGTAKCWPPERFAAVADRLIESAGAAVLVTCGPGEEPIAREIGRAMTRGGFVLDDPLLSLGELKSLVKGSDLLICNDAGPRHFAKAFDIPVVTIFGPTHPEWTATRYQAERIVRIDVECGPCQERVCPLGHTKCMTGVTVDAVVEAALGLLRSGAVARASDDHADD